MSSWCVVVVVGDGKLNRPLSLVYISFLELVSHQLSAMSLMEMPHLRNPKP
jgi:hypothetical protein